VRVCVCVCARENSGADLEIGPGRIRQLMLWLADQSIEDTAGMKLLTADREADMMLVD